MTTLKCDHDVLAHRSNSTEFWKSSCGFTCKHPGDLLLKMADAGKFFMEHQCFKVTSLGSRICPSAFK